MCRTLIAGILLLLISSGSAQGQVAKLYPVDEAHEDPSFLSFRLHLLEAIADRDTLFIYEHLAPDVFNSFGGDGGVEEFKEQWKPSSPDSDLWRVLARVAGGGGTYADGAYRAPYYSAAFPADEYDAFQYGAVVGERVNVRAHPDGMSEVIGRLSYDIVRVLDFFPHMNQSGEMPPGWVQIELEEGRRGYVADRYIGSAVGYRGQFEKRNGRWVMTYLVAGD